MNPQVDAAHLIGRVALVTGVSRRQGIGWAVARHLRAGGATVVATGWRPHDAEMAWGADPDPLAADGSGGGAEVGQHDLEDPAVPGALVDEVVDRHGSLDVVVAAHARSSAQSLADVLIDRGIAVTCINPGPVDTGRAPPGVHEAVAGSFPSGRWTTPAEVADVVDLLLRDEAAALAGQVIDAEHGFRRWPSGGE